MYLLYLKKSSPKIKKCLNFNRGGVAWKKNVPTFLSQLGLGFWCFFKASFNV